MEKDPEKIFIILKNLLNDYSPPFKARKSKTNKKNNYELWSEKKVEIAGRIRSEVFFASIIKQKNYIGFYYMPVYTDSKLKEVFAPELLSLLKGKSCFHIKSLDKDLEKQIKEALITGLKLYKKRGWV